VKGLKTVESSNDSVLRVVWLCFDVDQFRAIIHDSDRTQSLPLEAELFPVRCHVKHDNDDLAWWSGRDHNPWEQQLLTEPHNRRIRREAMKLWRWASLDNYSVVDKSLEKTLEKSLYSLTSKTLILSAYHQIPYIHMLIKHTQPY